MSLLMTKYLIIWQRQVIFWNLKRRESVSEKEMKYLVCYYKNANHLGKLYLLPIIYKGHSNVPGRPAICNGAIPTKKASEFLDYH